MVLVLPITAPGDPGSEITSEQDGGALLRRSILPGGVRVITEKIPGMRSATVGAWIGVGSRDEARREHGASHYLEHLLFKGTRRRSAQDIARVFDAAGGEANAATGKEYTCYYARIVDKDVPSALDVICDMITAPALDEVEFERERGVILEEISMHLDDPADLAFENFAQSLFPDHGLGRPIAGTTTEIQKISHSDIADYYRAHYQPAELVIAAAGGVDHEEICRQVTTVLKESGWLNARANRPSTGKADDVLPQPESASHTHYRPGEQANLLIGSRGLTATDERRYVLSVLHAIYGGGMSSRLFQKIREERGLAYAVHSFSSGFRDAGMFGVYAGCAVENAEQVLSLIAAEWDTLLRSGINEDELERARGQVRGGLVLGLEDSSARMSRLARAELVFGELATLDETIGRIDAVASADIMNLVEFLHEQPVLHTAVGPFEDGIEQILPKPQNLNP